MPSRAVAWDRDRKTPQTEQTPQHPCQAPLPRSHHAPAHDATASTPHQLAGEKQRFGFVGDLSGVPRFQMGKIRLDEAKKSSRNCFLEGIPQEELPGPTGPDRAYQLPGKLLETRRTRRAPVLQDEKTCNIGTPDCEAISWPGRSDGRHSYARFSHIEDHQRHSSMCQCPASARACRTIARSRDIACRSCARSLWMKKWFPGNIRSAKERRV